MCMYSMLIKRCLYVLFASICRRRALFANYISSQLLICFSWETEALSKGCFACRLCCIATFWAIICPRVTPTDIKKLYRMTGVDNKPTVFLFNDTQIVDESFLEDINNILSSGEVPNLYKPDEFEEVGKSLCPTVSLSVCPSVCPSVCLSACFHLLFSCTPWNVRFRNVCAQCAFVFSLKFTLTLMLVNIKCRILERIFNN